MLATLTPTMYFIHSSAAAYSKATIGRRQRGLVSLDDKSAKGHQRRRHVAGDALVFQIAIETPRILLGNDSARGFFEVNNLPTPSPKLSTGPNGLTADFASVTVSEPGVWVRAR